MNKYDPFKNQVAGNHYKYMSIQPVEYIYKNNIGFIEGNIIKYVSRWRSKGGLDDLKKARHFIELLMSMENETTQTSTESGEGEPRQVGSVVQDEGRENTNRHKVSERKVQVRPHNMP